MITLLDSLGVCKAVAPFSIQIPPEDPRLLERLQETVFPPEKLKQGWSLSQCLYSTNCNVITT